jgi:hypothetical protein
MRIASIPSQEGRTLPHRAAVIAASLAVAGLAATPAIAQGPVTLTFKETNKGSTFRFIDNPPRSTKAHRGPSVGDNLVFSNPLVSAAGARRGTLRASCTITGSSEKVTPAICYGVYSLKEGQLVAVVSTDDLNAKTTVGTIVGGNRAYAGARGTFSSTQTKTGADDTVTLTG